MFVKYHRSTLSRRANVAVRALGPASLRVDADWSVEGTSRRDEASDLSRFLREPECAVRPLAMPYGPEAPSGSVYSSITTRLSGPFTRHLRVGQDVFGDWCAPCVFVRSLGPCSWWPLVAVGRTVAFVRALRRRSAEQERPHPVHVALGLVLVGVVPGAVQVEEPGVGRRLQVPNPRGPRQVVGDITKSCGSRISF
jgi:hypothetical protein